LENDTGNLNALPGNGPCTDITGATFWIWLRDFGCSGLATVATGGRFADNAAAVLIDGSGNNGNGFIYISDSNFALGGIKYKPGAGTPGTVYFNNITEEGDFTHDIPPAVWFTAGLPTEGNLTGIQIADPGPTFTPVVQNDAGGSALTIMDAGSIQGAGVVLSQYQNTFVNSTVNPLRNGQVGFFNGYVKGNTDVARRIAGLVPARFVNKANNNSSAWTYSNVGGTTVTTGQADPYGGTAATKVAFNTSSVQNAQLGACVSYTPVTGDWIVAGAWVQGMSPTNISLYPGCWGAGDPTFSVNYGSTGLQVGTATDWQFRWFAGKVTANRITQIGLSANYSNTLWTRPLHHPQRNAFRQRGAGVRL